MVKYLKRRDSFLTRKLFANIIKIWKTYYSLTELRSRSEKLKFIGMESLCAFQFCLLSGLQLSFAATLSIIIFNNKIKYYIRKLMLRVKLYNKAKTMNYENRKVQFIIHNLL